MKRINILVCLLFIVINISGCMSTAVHKSNSKIIEEEVIIGTSGNDTINTDEGNDNISAGKGNDEINSGDGNDLISAGDGNDTITDGAGNDVVKVGDGTDYINLGPGDDTLVIKIAEDIGRMNFADGGEGNDTLIVVMENVNDALRNDIIQYFDAMQN